METKEVIFFHTDIHRSVKCAFIVQNSFFKWHLVLHLTL